jgi:hypothetical protein
VVDNVGTNRKISKKPNRKDVDIGQLVIAMATIVAIGIIAFFATMIVGSVIGGSS